MRAVYAILKANNYGPEIKDGNRLTGIKSIDFGTYDKKTGRDGMGQHWPDRKQVSS